MKSNFKSNYFHEIEPQIELFLRNRTIFMNYFHKSALGQIKMVRNAHPPIQPESHDLGQTYSMLAQQIQQPMPTSSEPSTSNTKLDPLLFSKAVTRRSAPRKPPKKQAYIHNPLRKRSRMATYLNPKKLQRFNTSDYLENIRRLRQNEKSKAVVVESSDSETDERGKKGKRSGKKWKRTAK